MTRPKKITGLRLVKLFCFFLFFYLFQLPFSASAFVSVSGDETKKALLLYEAEHRFGDPYPLIDALEELLGHFSLQVKSLPRSKWKKGMLLPYNLVIYLGTEKASLPSEFLQETAEVPSLLWLEENIEQLAAFRQWSDFTFKGSHGYMRSLEYKGISIDLRDDVALPLIDPGPGAVIIAFMEDGAAKVPFAWQKENLYYSARLYVDIPQSALLTDILHEICSEEHTERQQILLSIDDINPFSDPEGVFRLIDTVAEDSLPFALKVTPAVQWRGDLITLEDKPELSAVLLQATQMGAAIIQKGTELRSDRSASLLEETEFWNFKEDSSLPLSEEDVREKIELGLEIFMGSSLYPVAFEVPGYAVSGEGYRVLAEYFTSLSGRVLLSDSSSDLVMDLPYVSFSPRAGMWVYPHTIMCNPGDQISREKMLMDIRRFLLLRDAFVGISFSSHTSPGYLALIIERLKPLGFDFADLRTISVQGNSQIQSPVSQGIFHNMAQEMPAENPVGKSFLTSLLEIFLFIIGMIILIFLIIVRSLQRNRNRLYEESSKGKVAGNE